MDVFRMAIGCLLCREPARRIARQPVTDFTARSPVKHHFRDRVQRVVTVRPAAAVRIYLLRQTVQHIMAEPVAFSVLVRERDQTPVSIVPERRPAPCRVCPAAQAPALPVPLPARYPPHRAGVLHQPARRVRLVIHRAAVRQYHPPSDDRCRHTRSACCGSARLSF